MKFARLVMLTTLLVVAGYVPVWESLPSLVGRGFSPVGRSFSDVGRGFSPVGRGFSPVGRGFSPDMLLAAQKEPAKSWNFDDEEEDAPTWASDLRDQAGDIALVAAFCVLAFISFFRKSRAQIGRAHV